MILNILGVLHDQIWYKQSLFYRDNCSIKAFDLPKKSFDEADTFFYGWRYKTVAPPKRLFYASADSLDKTWWLLFHQGDWSIKKIFLTSRQFNLLVILLRYFLVFQDNCSTKAVTLLKQLLYSSSHFIKQMFSPVILPNWLLD